MKHLPKKIIVVREYEGTNDEYLAAHHHADEVAEIGRKIHAGVYVLEKTIIVQAEIKLTAK